MALKTLRPRLTVANTQRITPPPKTADPYYLTPEHRAWRTKVMERADWRCEHIYPSTGMRCTRRAPKDRLFADHIKERRDGGDLTDPTNGKALCGSHHATKTAQERGKRAVT